MSSLPRIPMKINSNACQRGKFPKVCPVVLTHISNHVELVHITMHHHDVVCLVAGGCDIVRLPAYEAMSYILRGVDLQMHTMRFQVSSRSRKKVALSMHVL